MKKKLIPLVVIAGMVAAGSAKAQEVSTALEHSLSKTLSTEAYTGILKSMVNPETLSDPVRICAECHGGEDMARYHQSLAPMMRMMNPVNWVDPNAYLQMAAPVVDPKTYETWYNAYIKKYGPLLGVGGEEASEEAVSE